MTTVVTGSVTEQQITTSTPFILAPGAIVTDSTTSLFGIEALPIEPADPVTIVIAGLVQERRLAVYVDAGPGTSVQVTQTGAIHAASPFASNEALGIQFNTPGALLTIAGFVSAEADAITDLSLLGGHEIRITETGVVIGGSNRGRVPEQIQTAALVLGGATNRVTNNGDIIGERDDRYGQAVALADTIGNLANGRLAGQGGSENALDFVNSGSVTGDVLMFGGADAYDARGGGILEGVLDLGAGDDTMFGGDTREEAFGGDGFDRMLAGDGDDSLDGGGGNDTLAGQAGDDLLDGGSGVDVLRGGEGDDVLLGGSLNSDVLSGGAGDDTLDGEAGNNTLAGGAGDDSLRGGWGNAEMRGGTGDDVLRGSGGADLILGGTGDDSASGGDGLNTLIGGAGEDTLRGGSDPDRMQGGDGGDTATGGAGNDTMQGGDGDDTLDGGTGVDVLRGGAGDDALFGGGFNSDRVFGGAGDDTLEGGGGNNLLDAGPGDDLVLGGSGSDTIAGGRGDDTVSGGTTGADVIVFRVGDGRDAVRDHGPGDRIDLTDFGVADYAALQATFAVFDAAAGLVIDFGDGDRLLIEGESVASLNNSDFLF